MLKLARTSQSAAAETMNDAASTAKTLSTDITVIKAPAMSGPMMVAAE